MKALFDKAADALAESEASLEEVSSHSRRNFLKRAGKLAAGAAGGVGLAAVAADKVYAFGYYIQRVSAPCFTDPNPGSTVKAWLACNVLVSFQYSVYSSYWHTTCNENHNLYHRTSGPKMCYVHDGAVRTFSGSTCCTQ